MYKISKRIEVAGSHHLNLQYDSKCKNIHGHNWIITIYCACKDEDLDENGMVVDFALIKEKITNRIDHKNLNEVVDFNPTAENLAKWICNSIPHCYKVTVQESEGNIAEYVNDKFVSFGLGLLI